MAADAATSHSLLAYHLQNGQEYNTWNGAGENSLRGVEHVSMPDDPYVNGRDYEQAFRYVQTRNPAFEPACHDS